MGYGDPRRDIRIVDDDPLIDLQARSVCTPVEVIQQERCHLLAGDAPPISQTQPFGKHGIMQIRVELIVVGKWNGNHESRCDREGGTHADDVGDLIGIFGHPIEVQSTRPQIEPRECVGLISNDAHIQGFQAFECGADVENGFHSGADNGYWDRPQRRQVSRLIPAHARIAVNAAEAARGKDRDPAEVREVTRGCDGGGTAALTGSHDGKITNPDLGDVVAHGDLDQLLIGETDPNHAVEHCNRRWNGTPLSHPLLNLTRDSKILWSGQAVTDDG